MRHLVDLDSDLGLSFNLSLFVLLQQFEHVYFIPVHVNLHV